MLKYWVIFHSLAILAHNFVLNEAINFNGKIAGDLTLEECVHGYEPTLTNTNNTRQFITTTQFIKKNGYPTEEHVVETEDGYILTLHRIPGKPGSPPVFIQHGLLGSSFEWIVTGENKSLVFLLSDAGYDVWLGNYRGNTYSRCHTTYKSSDKEFWDFSWHEMGIYDLPAMISYVTDTTGQQIIYIGHSMGTTTFFVMAIERPDIAEKVKVMTALAPVAFLEHNTSPIKVLAPYWQKIELIFMKLRKTGEFFSQSSYVKSMLKYACTLSWLQKEICTSLLFFVTDYHPPQFNNTLLKDILYHYPAGTSLKTLLHFLQEMNSGRFQNYDHGPEKNLKLYNSTQPPDYDISKIQVPVGLIWSISDVFTHPVDVMELYNRLPNLVLNYRVPHPAFHHNDFLFATDAPKNIYSKILSFIENYR